MEHKARGPSARLTALQPRGTIGADFSPSHSISRAFLRIPIIMSKSQPSKVFLFDHSDPEMQGAYEKARANFRFFWREVAWERRRIVPALDVACVKAPFSDGDPGTRRTRNPEVEQMWLGDVDFDGQAVSGVLLNAPNWLKSVKAGDSARFPLDEITDWMYVDQRRGVWGLHGQPDALADGEDRNARSTTTPGAWTLAIRRRSASCPTGRNRADSPLKTLFGVRGDADDQEHPMSEAMAPVAQE